MNALVQDLLKEGASKLRCLKRQKDYKTKTKNYYAIKPYPHIFLRNKEPGVKWVSRDSINSVILQTKI